MTCNFCGKPLNEDDVFCSQCGNKVELDISETPDDEANVVLDPETTINTSEEDVVELESVETEETEEADLTSSESPDEEFDETTGFRKTIDPEDALFENEGGYEDSEDYEDSEEYDEDSDEIEEETEQPEANIKQRKKLAKIHKRKIGAHFGAFALSILLAILMITTLAVFVIRSAITENSIKEIFSSLKLEEITIDSRADKNDLEELGIKCESDNVLDIIYDNIDQDALKEPLTKEQFEKIIKSDSVSEFFGDLIGKNLEAVVNGESVSLMTTDDIIRFIEKEEAMVSDILGYELTEDHKNNLRTTLDINFGDAFKSLEIKELKHMIGKGPAVLINVLFSDWLFIGLLVICVLVLILIFLVLRSFRLGLLYNGITLTVVNFMYLVCALALMFGILDLLLWGINAKLLTQVVGIFLWDLVIITFTAVFVGVIMIIVSRMIKKYLIKRRS